MELLNQLVLSVNNVIWTYILIAALIVLGIYFTVKTNFVQFRYLKEMFRLLGEGASKGNKKEGQVSSFQAFCISTASRVGTGNIAGVAMAIVLGRAWSCILDVAYSFNRICIRLLWKVH